MKNVHSEGFSLLYIHGRNFPERVSSLIFFPVHFFSVLRLIFCVLMYVHNKIFTVKPFSFFVGTASCLGKTEQISLFGQENDSFQAKSWC